MISVGGTTQPRHQKFVQDGLNRVLAAAEQSYKKTYSAFIRRARKHFLTDKDRLPDGSCQSEPGAK